MQMCVQWLAEQGKMVLDQQGADEGNPLMERGQADSTAW